MKIAIDIDGVLRDFVGAVHQLMIHIGRWDIKEPAPVIDRWEMQDYYKMDRGQFYDLLFRSQYTCQLFASALPYVGAKAFIDRLCDQHQVGLVTSQCYEGAKGTLRWLYCNDIIRPSVHFVFFDRGDFDKTQFGYEILLDDKPSNVQQFLEKGLVGLLYDQPWNRDADMPRVMSYQDFLEIIKTLT